jgi:AcrR family transcriptional regulator
MPSDAAQTRPPAAPPPAGRPALTREQVLVAALEIIDQDGVEALTMRRLGQALDRNPMGIYRHAADKDALLDGVVEHVLSALVVFGDPGVDWETALRRTAQAFRRIALAHPNAVPLLVTRSVTGPLALRPLGTLRLLEELLEVFIGAGFDPHGALHATRLFTGFLYGHLQDELQQRSPTPMRPTTCSASDCIAYPSPSSPGCGPSPPSWPPTTAPPNSTKDWTSSSRACAANSSTDHPPRECRHVPRAAVPMT